jgi:hypothetical protein
MVASAMNVMNTNSSKRTLWGFSTPYTMVNVALVGLAVLGSGTLGLSSMHKMATMASYPGLNHQGQSASGIIASDIRRASSVESATGERLVLRMVFAGHESTVSYVYDAATRTLTRTDAHGSQTLLTDVDRFSFSLFQRPAPGAAFAQFLPASGTEAKMIGCRWTCSRKLAGSKLDSESIEVAPVVLRNRC